MSFVDVVNYSAQMAADEAGTHRRWMTALSDIVRPKVINHGGSIVKSTGDGVLTRFGSVLGAVEWAEDVQRALQNSSEQDGPGLELRISVHLGDVIATDDDIFGDGVNVAARLIEHAAPGGIVLSEAVYELVRGSAGARAADLGLRYLKSYERPLRIYSLAPELARPAVRLAPAASVPSIAVMPLLNLGNDPGDVYFADGVAEGIVQSLSGLGELLVVSLGSTLAMRGQPIDPREVGRLLGVRYVLTGSLLRSASALRARMQLVDATDGAAVWGESAEATPDELFDFQDRIVAKVVAGIAPNVRASELRRAMRKRPERFSAYDHMLRGMHLVHSLDAREFKLSLDCFHRAIADDPFFSMPFAWIAFWHSLNVGQGQAADADDDIGRAGLMAARAIELDGNNALALAIYGHVKSYLFHQYDLGLVYLERAISACPNSPLARLYLSATLAYTGSGKEAVVQAMHGLRLSPLDRSIFHTYTILCLAHYSDGNFDEAIRWGRVANAANPRFTAAHRLLISSFVAEDRLDEARLFANAMMLIEPEFSVGAWVETRQPFADWTVAGDYARRLLIAGLPA